MRIEADTYHRVVSLIVYASLIIHAGICVGGEMALRTARGFLLAMFCIWFPEAMSKYTGILLGGGRFIDEPSHPTFLRYTGWFFLLGVPAIGVIFAQNSG